MNQLKVPLITGASPTLQLNPAGVALLARLPPSVHILSILATAKHASLIARFLGVKKQDQKSANAFCYIRPQPVHGKNQSGHSFKLVYLFFQITKDNFQEALRLSTPLSDITAIVYEQDLPIPNRKLISSGDLMWIASNCQFQNFEEKVAQLIGTNQLFSKGFKDQLFWKIKCSDIDSPEFIQQLTLMKRTIFKFLNNSLTRSGDQLACYLQHLIIQSDSRRVFQNLDILTAKNAINKAYTYYLSLQRPLKVPDQRMILDASDQLFSILTSRDLDLYCLSSLKELIQQFNQQKRESANRKQEKQISGLLDKIKQKIIFKQENPQQITTVLKSLMMDLAILQNSSQKIGSVLIQSLIGVLEAIFKQSEEKRIFTQRVNDGQAKTSRTQINKDRVHFQKIISGLQRQIVQLTAHQKELSRKINQLQESEHNEKTPSLSQSQVLIRDEQSQLKCRTLLIQRSSLRNNLQQLQLKNAMRVQLLQDTIRDRQSTISQLVQQNQQFKAKVNSEIQIMIERASNQTLGFRNAISLLEQERGQLRSALQQRQDQINRLNFKNEQLKATLENQISIQNKQITRLNSQLDRQQELSRLQKNQIYAIQILEERLLYNQKQLKLSRQQSNQLRLQLQRSSALLTQKLGFASQQNQLLEKERGQLLSRVSMFGDILQQKEQQQREQLRRLKAQQDEQVNSMQKVFGQYKSQIRQLRDLNFQLQSQRVILQSENNHLKRQVRKQPQGRMNNCLQVSLSIQGVTQPLSCYQTDIQDLKKALVEQRQSIIQTKVKEFQHRLFQAQLNHHLKLQQLQAQLVVKDTLALQLSNKLQLASQQLVQLQTLDGRHSLANQRIQELQNLIQLKSKEHTLELKKVYEQRQRRQACEDRAVSSISLQAKISLESQREQLKSFEKISRQALDKLRQNFQQQLTKAQIQTHRIRTTLRQTVNQKSELQFSLQDLKNKNESLQRHIIFLENSIEDCKRQREESIKNHRKQLQSQREHLSAQTRNKLGKACAQVELIEKKYQTAKQLLKDVQNNYKKQIDRIRREKGVLKDRFFQQSCNSGCDQKLLFVTQEYRQLKHQLQLKKQRCEQLEQKSIQLPQGKIIRRSKC